MIPPDLTAITLVSGVGDGTPGNRCAMQEVRAWLDLDATSDAAPECVSPVIRVMVVGLNDASERTRAMLVSRLPAIIGTRSTPDVERARSLMALDWLIRVYTLAWLDLVPALVDHAAALRALPPVSDDTAAALGGVLFKARAAALDAAGHAARDTGEIAKWIAERVATEYAVGNMAVRAAESAACSADVTALAPTVARCQDSVMDLLDRMIARGAP